MTALTISEITIGPRHRKELGDLQSLADSIDAIGLLQPIGVTKDKTLVFGRRRLEACKLLKWGTIDAKTIDLLAEHDENTVRKDFTPMEAVAIGEAIEGKERKKAKERQATGAKVGGATAGKGWPKKKQPSAKFAERKPANPPSIAKAAAVVGMSRPTYEKAKAIVKAAEARRCSRKLRKKCETWTPKRSL